MSDDYTPTTGEVRAVYASASFVKTAFNKYDSNAERGLAEFDRWLAEHDRQKFYGHLCPHWPEIAAATFWTLGVLDLMEEEPHE